MAMDDLLEGPFQVMQSERTTDVIVHGDVVCAMVSKELLKEP